MQQTGTYKLNLIETSDTFSPNPLNENTEKLEKALSEGLASETSARTAADQAEASARAEADQAEASARAAADQAEATTRQQAVSAEAAARQQAISDEASTRAAAITALQNRVTTLEAHKIAVGYANTTPTYVGFTPMAVIITNGTVATLAVTGSNNGYLSIIDGGFSHTSNLQNCHYIALS